MTSTALLFAGVLCILWRSGSLGCSRMRLVRLGSGRRVIAVCLELGGDPSWNAWGLGCLKGSWKSPKQGDVGLVMHLWRNFGFAISYKVLVLPILSPWRSHISKTLLEEERVNVLQPVNARFRGYLWRQWSTTKLEIKWRGFRLLFSDETSKKRDSMFSLSLKLFEGWNHRAAVKWNEKRFQRVGPRTRTPRKRVDFCSRGGFP